MLCGSHEPCDRRTRASTRTHARAHTQDLSWAAGKKFMGNADAFLRSLLSFDKANVPVNCVERARAPRLRFFLEFRLSSARLGFGHANA